MRTKKLLAVSFCVALFLAGFVFGGSKTEAADNRPGSGADPLVTRSYVDTAVNEKIKALEQEISSLQAKVNQLKEQVSHQQKSVGTPSPGNTGSTSIMGTGSISAKSGAILRQGPDTVFSKAGTLAYGTKVTVLKESNGWYQVKTPSGTTGWVFGELLDLTN